MKERIFRRPKVQEMTGLHRSSIYAAIKEGSFPPPVKLSARAVGWRESDLERWLAERPLAAACNELTSKSGGNRE